MKTYSDGTGTGPYVAYVLYHSREWDFFVETGWITATVTNGIARMVKEGS